MNFDVRPIGYVQSSLHDRAQAPKQGFEGAPESRIVFDAAYRAALADVRAGDEIIVLTWLDRARRDILTTHPRDDRRLPLTGIFSTRSPDRPNPIGLHRVKVIAVPDALTLVVADLEALDQTPVIDVKPVLPGRGDA